MGGTKAVLIGRLETAFGHQPAVGPVAETAKEHPANTQLRGQTNAQLKAGLRVLGLPVSGRGLHSFTFQLILSHV